MSTHLIISRHNAKLQNTIFIFLNYKMKQPHGRMSTKWAPHDGEHPM